MFQWRSSVNLHNWNTLESHWKTTGISPVAFQCTQFKAYWIATVLPLEDHWLMVREEINTSANKHGTTPTDEPLLQLRAIRSLWYSTEDEWFWMIMSVLLLFVILISQESETLQWINSPQLQKESFSKASSTIIYSSVATLMISRPILTPFSYIYIKVSLVQHIDINVIVQNQGMKRNLNSASISTVATYAISYLHE